jgi:hypothetical protein
MPEAVHTTETPPVFGTWRRMYVVVIAALAISILLLIWFSKAFQ